MKKSFSIGLVLLIAIFFTGCSGTSTDKKASESGSSTKTSKSSNKMDRDEGASKMMEISEKMQNGDITKEKGKKMQDDIKAQMETQEDMLKRTNSNISDFNGMPAWAKDLNISEPVGVSLIAEESDIIKAKGSYPDSFLAVYEGDAQKLMSEAKRLSKEFGFDEELEQTGLYMNSGKVGKYSVSITVADNGEGMRMTYVASDLSEV